MQLSILVPLAFAASASAATIRARQTTPETAALQTFTFSTNSTYFDACRDFTKACFALQGNEGAFAMSTTCGFRGQIEDQAPFIEASCLQQRYLSNTGTWKHTNQAAKIAGLLQVYDAPTGSCEPEVSYGRCSRAEYDTTPVPF